MENIAENDEKFIQEAMKNLKPGASKNFKCPICGKMAYVARSVNHLYAQCSGCGFTVRV